MLTCADVCRKSGNERSKEIAEFAARKKEALERAALLREERKAQVIE
jgi:hypothetical protein